jgi:hypothetical protein
MTLDEQIEQATIEAKNILDAKIKVLRQLDEADEALKALEAKQYQDEQDFWIKQVQEKKDFEKKYGLISDIQRLSWYFWGSQNFDKLTFSTIDKCERLYKINGDDFVKLINNKLVFKNTKPIFEFTDEIGGIQKVSRRQLIDFAYSKQIKEENKARYDKSVKENEERKKITTK